MAETYSKGKHGRLDKNPGVYKKFVEKTFSNVFGDAPKWARIKKSKKDDPMLQVRST